MSKSPNTMPDSSDKRTDRDKQSTDPASPRWIRGTPNFWLLMLLLLVTLTSFLFQPGFRQSEITEDFFLTQLRAGNVAEISYVRKNQISGLFRNPPPAPPTLDEQGKSIPRTSRQGNPVMLQRRFMVFLDPQMSERQRQELEALYQEHDVQRRHAPQQDRSALYLTLASILIPLLVLLVLWNMFRRTRDQLMGGGFLSGFTKSPATRFEDKGKPTTFKDVAGLTEVKADLIEVIEFLKDPDSFRRLGARVPKGILLNGPPGTGKTLLARAVAGEAGVPFYSVNGSEFIQMFVGVGASRVRDLFQTAKANAPAIIFIDEIDAVGRQRGAGLGGGHDEREQTLNQILSEMDGFAQTDTVIVMAATNRPDVLDPALLRPGRFDRHVTVDRPTLKGRKEMFKVHVRDVPLDDDVNLDRLAEGTVGMTGADIRNLVNEAALWATRQQRNRVTMEDFEYARDKVLMGPKREEVLLGKEKEKTAYHEAGHALIAWFTEGNDRIHKVTVIPRGRALGVTQTLPEEDRMNITETELMDRLAFMLGGRSAEKLVYDEISAGAENDLERATSIARRMVTKWGMSKRLGPVSYKMSDEDPFLGREMHQQRQFSERTLQIVDEEISTILSQAEHRAQELLTQHRGDLDTLARALVEQEELSDEEIRVLIGPSAHDEEDAEPDDSLVSGEARRRA